MKSIKKTISLLVIGILFFVILLIIRMVILKKLSVIDTFQGVNENNIAPAAGLFVSGTTDEITDLNTYSQRITSLEQRVTTMEQQIKSFHDAMTSTPTSASS